jgi:hypothetical protein
MPPIEWSLSARREAEQQVRQRCFTRARVSDYRDGFALLDGEANDLQDPIFFLERKPDVVELDPRTGRHPRVAALTMADRCRAVERLARKPPWPIAGCCTFR